LSAILAITRSDACFLLTDAAVYTDDGTLTDIRSKQAVFEDLRMAASCRGNLAAIDLFSIAIGYNYGDFDAVRRDAPGIFKAVDAVIETFAPGRIYEIVVVGWSDERKRGEAVYHATHGKHPDGYNRNGPTLITDAFLPFGHFDTEFPENAIDFDPVAHGVPAFESARAALVEVNGGYYGGEIFGHTVGGFVQSTIVTSQGVTTDVIHNWSDRIGEKICPVANKVLAA
jgi:hypothetical protein